MAEDLFSPSWYRVARLRPALRGHLRFHRHHYRGQLWYVLQDPTTGRCHRLTPAAYQIAGLMNGERTTQEIWEAASTRLGDDGPTQDETIRVLGLLHFADALRCDVPPDTEEMLRRCQRRESGEWWQRFANPFSVRLPLIDPDAFLRRWLPWVRPLFSGPALLLWCAVVGAAGVLAAVHWADLTANLRTQLLDPRNLVVLWLVYPIVKAIHELGHAFATRVWGGEVHEMGVLFLVFLPMPYVDASAASAFPEKWRRITVDAAGILVELLLASLALFVWLAVEPGWIRSIAWNVICIGGASTLLFNGNPLLRFDGYYVLQDLVEIPNLGSRSSQYLGYLAQRRGFGLEQVRNPVAAAGEERWLVGYGIASFGYRLVVVFGIAVFVAGRFFVVGILLALLAVAVNLVVPLARQVHFVLTSPRVAPRRGRALAVSAGAVCAVLAGLFVVPLPLGSRAQGIVWPPEGALVRAATDGFVEALLAEPDAEVRAGQPLVRMRDPVLEAEVAVLEARVRELRARYDAARGDDRVSAQIVLDELASVRAELTRARERAGDVILRSPSDGSFVVPGGVDLAGRFLEQGDLVGYVVSDAITTARVVVSQEDAALVRSRTRGVEVRLSRDVGEALPAEIGRQVPAATQRLPSRALGTEGGGPFPVDPRDPESLSTLETVFQLEVSFPARAAVREIGGRVYVRFDHGAEPVGLRAYRALRRLFLRQIRV